MKGPILLFLHNIGFSTDIIVKSISNENNGQIKLILILF